MPRAREPRKVVGTLGTSWSARKPDRDNVSTNHGAGQRRWKRPHALFSIAALCLDCARSSPHGAVNRAALPPATPFSIPISPADAGFAPDIEARLDKLIADKRAWGLHGIVVVRNDRLVLERYFEAEDNARGRPLGNVAFKPDTLHDLRSCPKSIIGLLYGIALSRESAAARSPAVCRVSRICRPRRAKTAATG